MEGADLGGSVEAAAAAAGVKWWWGVHMKMGRLIVTYA